MKRQFALLLFFAAIGFTQTSADAIRQVAAKILAQIPPRSAVALDFENRSSTPAADADELRHGLEDALKEGGLTLSDGSETRLHAWISENKAGPLLIVQSGALTAIATWSRPPIAAKELRLTIQREIVREQNEPILDFLPVDQSTLILEPDRVVRIAPGQPDRIAPLTATTPMPRDPRGRLDRTPEGIRLSSPGTTCTVAPTPELKTTCPSGDPLHWAAGRNYFEDSELGRYYTTADTGNGLAIAAVDGTTRLAALTITGWGSDIAGIASICGSKHQVLATGFAAGDSQDYLQAFEITSAGAVPVSEPLILPGAVTALWPGDTPTAARLVVHNLRTGMYEASRISIACTQ
ncbi:MAG TPA: hypothetical protein VKU01_29960 [Bryobacteraceae bacterium]|nr:hypothetical protein [Bryobacteraceae bacterium]